MMDVASLFSKRAKDALKETLGITLEEKHDYSEEELEALYERITEDFPYEYSPSGQPEQLGAVFEELIDVFVTHHLVAF